MKMKQLALEVSKREGKRTGVNIAQINEVLAVLSDLAVKCPASIAALINNGVRRGRKA